MEPVAYWDERRHVLHHFYLLDGKPSTSGYNG